MKGGVYLNISNDDLKCPITLEIMEDPVIASDGFTYERDAIEEHMQKSRISPLTQERLRSILIPDRKIKQAIAEYMSETIHHADRKILDIRKSDRRIGNKQATRIQSIYRKHHSRKVNAVNKIAKIYKNKKYEPYFDFLKTISNIENTENEIEDDPNRLWKNLPASLKNDRDFVLEAARINGGILAFVNPQYLRDKEIVLLAVYSNAVIWNHLIHEMYNNDVDVVKAAMLGNVGYNFSSELYNVFEDCSDRIRNNRKFVLEILETDVEGQAAHLILNALPEKFYNDNEILLLLLEGNTKYFGEKDAAIRDFLDFWQEKIDGDNVIGDVRGGSIWDYLNINREDVKGSGQKKYDTVLKRLKFLVNKKHFPKKLREYSKSVGRKSINTRKKLNVISGIPSDLSRKIARYGGRKACQ